jgi:arsenical pump membrane protein
MEAEAVPTETGTTPPEPGEPAEPRRDHALAAFLPRLAVWAGVLILEVVADPDPTLSLLLIALAGVVTIVTDSRFAWEQRLEAIGVPSREAWVPLLMLVLMMQLDLVQLDGIGDVLVDKGPVIVFILAFALVAEGLRRSGFIHYLAYRLADRGGANTTRLLLYLFLLSSVLTYVTSNDIVVLTMTPIVVSVAYQARIRNAKLLLLSQFIAANTVSMGILIGSPTNLILGQAMDIRFVEYFFLMLAPSVIALMATFVFVTAINRLVERRADSRGRLTRWLVGTWTFTSGYRPPHFSEHQVLTREMRVWVGMFALSVALLTVGTASNTGLFLAALAIAAIGLGTLRYSARLRGEATGARFFGRTFRVFPLGIVFFGLTYFVLADAIADTRFVRTDVDEYVTDNASRHTPAVSWSAMLASGTLVNVMNDLPASALSGTVLERADFATPFDRALVVEGALAGLNTATYVTPVGALAGIIWFDILRKERRRRHADAVAAGREPFDVVMPQRRDLVVYGTTMFLATTAVLGATNYAFVAASDVLLAGPGERTPFGATASNAGWMAACAVVVVAVVLGFRRALAAAGVALARLGEVFAVVTRVRLWAVRHRLTASLGAVVLLLLGGLVLLYWSEGFYVRQHPRVDPLFDDLGGFVSWLTDPVSSGFASATLPRTLLGRILPALLAVGSAAAVLGLSRLSPTPASSVAAAAAAAPTAPTPEAPPTSGDRTRHRQPDVTATGRAGRRAGRRPRRGGRLRRR